MNLKNQMSRKENLILKRCLNCGEPGGLIFCNTCNDVFHKKSAVGIEDFQYKRVKKKQKTELNNVYKTIKIHSIINKEVKGFVCVEKIKIFTSGGYRMGRCLLRFFSCYGDVY